MPKRSSTLVCPCCEQDAEHRVIQTRVREDISCIRRIRHCLACGAHYETSESCALPHITQKPRRHAHL